MTLYIEVYVGNPGNRKMVARSCAHNITDLSTISGYKFMSEEFGEPRLNIPYSEELGVIENHNRKQSVWKLVEKIAKGST